MKFRVLLILFSIGVSQAFAQKSIKDSCISFTMLGAEFQYQYPGGDMADRFYNDYNVGAFLNFKFANNWLIGLEGNFLFADKVKENNILDSISTPDGNIISETG